MTPHILALPVFFSMSSISLSFSLIHCLYLSLFSFTRLGFCFSVCLCLCLSVRLSSSLFLSVFVCPFFCLFLCLCLSLSLCLSQSFSVFLSLRRALTRWLMITRPTTAWNMPTRLLMTAQTNSTVVSTHGIPYRLSTLWVTKTRPTSWRASTCGLMIQDRLHGKYQRVG